MIRLAEPGDHPQVKTLWREAFGDPVSAIDAYFQGRHVDANMLVDVRDGIVAGMLSMLPVTLVLSGGQALPARYLYAVASREAFSGRGVGTGLLNAAHARMQAMGEAASVLVPGNTGLFLFYEKRGYRTEFFLDEWTVEAADLPPLPPESRYGDCDPGTYASLRNLAFQQSGLYVRWDAKAVAYAVGTFAQPGGVAELRWAGGYGCAAWEKTAGGVLVRELALPEGDVFAALAVLQSALGFERCAVRLAPETVPGAVTRPFGMIRWLTPEPRLTGAPPYLSLAMD
jgi:predicted N-acetyltransferase YhbS